MYFLTFLLEIISVGYIFIFNGDLHVAEGKMHLWDFKDAVKVRVDNIIRKLSSKSIPKCMKLSS